MAADPEFKTFHAAYPYVVQKLLYENSAPTRTILYSVISSAFSFAEDVYVLFYAMTFDAKQSS